MSEQPRFDDDAIIQVKSKSSPNRNMQDFGKLTARQKKSPRDPGSAQFKMMQQSAECNTDHSKDVQGHMPQDAVNQDVSSAYEARLADYFAIVGLEDEILPIDGGAESLKVIEKCEIIVMERQEVTDAKKNLCITRNAKIKQQQSDTPLVTPEQEIDAIDRVRKVADLEKTPYEVPFYDPEHEKWIDLDGSQNFYLRLIYGKSNPITEFNFFYISSKLEHKIQIPENMEIQPVPIKRFDDQQADKKFHTVVKSNKGSNCIIFHGTYDLKYYLDRQEPIMPKAGTAPGASNSEKILCLCVKRRTKQGDMPVYDVNVIEGESPADKNKKVKYSLPPDSQVVTYRLGINKHRLMYFQKLDLLRTRFNPAVLDRYPFSNRPGYEFSKKIAEFCFPHGINLTTDHQVPQAFDFILTDSDGGHIFGSCLTFSEKPSQSIRLKLKQAKIDAIDKVWTQKAICILSHFSFSESFKQVLKKIYQIHLSQNMKIPIERFIVNVMDEVPLPDNGNIMIQHEMEETILFFRPIDQYPPFVTKTAIQNLFKALQVDDILELFSQLLLERKILLISEHKALLTQVAVALQSLIYPLQWHQNLIPILPTQMIDVLDAPFPFVFGIQASILQNALMCQHIILSNEITQVDLDSSKVFTQEVTSRVCKMPRDFKTLREKLLRAASGITERPDPDLEHVDDAFFRFMQDPDEIENYVDDIEVRDAFLEFMQRVLANYQKYLKDPGLNEDGSIPDHANARDFFHFEKFKADREATKSISFINKLTQTNNFCKFIEARSLGKTVNDEQIMHFDIQLKEKRTNQRRFLVQSFKEKKVVRSMQVNEEGLEKGKNYLYSTFPSRLDRRLVNIPRKPHSYITDDKIRSMHSIIVTNDFIQKMHEADWAKYMAEVIYCLWFQVFAATLPMYQAYSSYMVTFARKLLQYINTKLKPLKEIEIVYRRMFQACGHCMQLDHIKELYKELQQTQSYAGDKVTYGTYYQALVLCQRKRKSLIQSGRSTKPGESERKARYFNQEDIEYITALQKQEEEKERINNPNGIGKQTYPTRYSTVFAQKKRNDDDFDDIFDSQLAEPSDCNDQTRRAFAKQTSNVSSVFNQAAPTQIRLSQVLEDSLYIEICKECPHCNNPLKEEELLSGLQKNNSDYTSKCPYCLVPFVPKVTLYSEYKTDFINGREGLTLQLLPPVPLYKEFLNTLSKKGDRILTQEAFLQEHSVVFWNLVVYFKIMKLPQFILDQDYSHKHVKVQVSWINKYLPDKAFSSSSSKQATRSSFGSKTRLDKDGLSRLDRQQAAQSPQRNTSLSRIANGLYNKIKMSAGKGPSSQASGGASNPVQNDPKGQNESLVNNSSIQSFAQNVTSVGLTAVQNLVKQPSIGLVNLAKSATQSVKSGSGSVITSTSDLERFERIMVFAKNANKSIIRHFGKHLEEFRREMQYSKEIILSDLITQGIPESMIRHAENVNLGVDKQKDPLKQAILAKVSRQSSNLDNFQVEEPQDILNMARTSNLSGKGLNLSQESGDQTMKLSQASFSLKSQGSMSYVQQAQKNSMDLQMILDASENPNDQMGSNSPVKQRLPPKPMIMMQQRLQQKSPGNGSFVKNLQSIDNCSEDEQASETENARQSQHVYKQKPSLSNLQKLISPNHNSKSTEGVSLIKARKRALIISKTEGEIGDGKGQEEVKKKGTV